MKKSNWILFGITLAMIGGTAFSLLQFKSNQKLGTPGVKIGNVPLYDTETNRVAETTVILPEKILGFESTALPVTTVELGTLPSDTVYGKRRYLETNGMFVDLNVVVMGRDRTSIHKPEICVVSQGWSIDSSEPTHISMTQPVPYDLPVMKLTSTLQSKNERDEPVIFRGVFVYWFVDDEKITARHNQRMIWMAKDLLQNRVLKRWSYISYFSACLPGQEEETYLRLKDFITASAPEFQIPYGGEKSSATQPNLQTAFK